MKHFSSLLLILTLLFPGCNYLDVVPDNDIETIETIFEKRDQAENWFKFCHTFLMPYTASIISDPSYTGADEVVAGNFLRQQFSYAWAGFYIADGLQMTADPYGNIWRKDAAYNAIRYCNTFLEKIGDVYNMEEQEKVLWAAEIKALKAHYYFELLRRYGPIILVPENIATNAGISEMKQPRKPFDICVEAIVSLLDEAMKDLPPMNQKSVSRWAYHSLESAAALKAMTLFYAASPLFNGNPAFANFTSKTGENFFNQTPDRERWKRAAEAIDTALMLCLENGKTLVSSRTEGGAEDTRDLRTIMSDIEESSLARNFESSEAIFMIQYENRSLASWTRWTRPYFRSGTTDYNADLLGCIAPSIKMVEMYYTEHGLPINEDREWDYTSRYQIGKETDTKYKNVVLLDADSVLRLHLRREPRFYAHIAADRCYFQRGNSIDEKNDLVRAYQGERFGTLYTQISNSQPQNLTGYYMKKGSRSSQSNVDYKNTFSNEEACVLIRLADLYLMKAEAWNEYLDAPDKEHVYDPLNAVRERAGIPDVEFAWQNYSTNPGKVRTKEGMRQIIRQEWNVEFAFEGRRFWNLRRWLTAAEELNSDLCGWLVTGKNPRQFYNNFEGPVPVWSKRQFISPRDYLFPIRSEEILISGCEQNPNW